MAATYYKATRQDGTDFRTGTLLYEVGERVEHPVSRRFADLRPNDPGTYLSVSVEPGEVLTGGEWPCRLFRVEPVGRTVKRTDGVHPWKRGCRALRVVEELPAHAAFGPNGELVVALIERARLLTIAEAGALGAAWDAAWVAARVAARDAAGDAARVAARDAAGDAAQVAAWDAARGAARFAAGDAARVAAWVAALALLVRDLITVDQFNLLHGPWASVIGARRRAA